MQDVKNISQHFIQQMMLNFHPDLLNTMLWKPDYRQGIISLIAGMEIQISRDLLQNNIATSYDDGIDLFMEEYYKFLLKDTSLIKKALRASRLLLQQYQFQVLPDFEVRISPFKSHPPSQIHTLPPASDPRSPRLRPRKCRKRHEEG